MRFLDLDNEIVRAYRRGKEAWNKGRNEQPELRNIHFEVGTVFEQIDFSGFNLNGINFNQCKFHAVLFRGAILNSTAFERAEFDNKCDFSESHGSPNFAGATMMESIFNNTMFHAANFRKAIFLHCHFSSVRFSNSLFEDANLEDHALINCGFDGCNFTRAPLKGAKFTGSSLDSSDFQLSDLRGANLVGIRVDSQTGFSRAQVDGTVIDRLTLECLDNYGGLSKGERYRMTILDDFAVLRQSYSGFAQRIHLFFLVLFLFPYVWFVIQQWTYAHWSPDAPLPTIPLLEALLKYITSGGRSWGSTWDFQPIPLTIFSAALCYNIFRGILLWKTMRLELEQEIMGLPSRFSFALHPKWRTAYRISKVLFWINLALVLVHTLWFLGLRVPIRQ